MNIFDLFKKYKLDFNKLEQFGFIKENDYYLYSKKFFDNNFKCIIKIDKLGNIEDKVIDLDTNLEYLNIKLVNGNSYVKKVQELYKEILLEIREECFIEKYFVYDLSNQICNYINNKYGALPEFLWNNSPHGVFRNKENNKWYAIIMNIDGKYCNLKGNIEVINVKINEDDLDNLLKEKGIFKAYHMNKKKWISILLDGSVDLNRIEELIDISYYLVNKVK